MRAGIIPVKSALIAKYNAITGFSVTRHKIIPIIAITKHAISDFVHPPIPRFKLRKKIRIDCKVDIAAKYIAT